MYSPRQIIPAFVQSHQIYFAPFVRNRTIETQYKPSEKSSKLALIFGGINSLATLHDRVHVSQVDLMDLSAS